MIKTITAPAALLIGLGALAGCANDGTLATSNLTTSAVTPAAAPKPDPACVTLAAQIETLRKEGTIDRLQQAADGKSASVQVKRAALSKQAELNKANAEFQARCGTVPVKPATTAAAPVAKDVAAASAQPSAKADTPPAPAKQTAKKPDDKPPVTKAAVVSPAPAPVTTSIAPTTTPITSRPPDVIVSMPPPQQ